MKRSRLAKSLFLSETSAFSNPSRVGAATGLAQPLVAPGEHRGDEARRGFDVVVEVGEKSYAFRREFVQSPKRSFAEVLVRVLDDRRLGAERESTGIWRVSATQKASMVWMPRRAKCHPCRAFG